MEEVLRAWVYLSAGFGQPSPSEMLRQERAALIELLRGLQDEVKVQLLAASGDFAEVLRQLLYES